MRVALENSPQQSNVNARIRSKPHCATERSCAPVMYFRRSMQKLGATSGAVRGISERMTRAKDAFVLSTSFFVFPPAYSKMSISSRDGWMILLTFPPRSCSSSSRAMWRSVKASCGMICSFSQTALDLENTAFLPFALFIITYSPKKVNHLHKNALQNVCFVLKYYNE